jgi:hypothetical protein
MIFIYLEILIFKYLYINISAKIGKSLGKRIQKRREKEEYAQVIPYAFLSFSLLRISLSIRLSPGIWGLWVYAHQKGPLFGFLFDHEGVLPRKTS